MEILKKVLERYFNINLIDKDIKNVKMNSKEVEKDSLFFAINQGNNYIKDAFERGASLVIADNISEELKGDRNIIQVENTIEVMQSLARLYRKELKAKIIAVTGSEGKTSTKDLIYRVLNYKYRGIKTFGNYNNTLGVPYTIFQISENDEIAVLELGMNKLGEIDFLSEMVAPDYGVITNIGDSHLQYLINRDNVFLAKTELLNHLEKNRCFVYGDDIYLSNIGCRKIGFSSDNEFMIEILDKKLEGTKFKVNGENYYIPLNGEYNCINATFAIAIGQEIGLSSEEIKQALETVEITKMRFQKINSDGKIYINDAYNASPVSMEEGLKTFNELDIKNHKKIIVLGDMLELGKNELEYHKNILRKALDMGFEQIYTYGNLMKISTEALNDSRLCYMETKNNIKEKLKAQKDIVIFLKGSRGMKLEEIID